MLEGFVGAEPASSAGSDEKPTRFLITSVLPHVPPECRRWRSSMKPSNLWNGCVALARDGSAPKELDIVTVVVGHHAELDIPGCLRSCCRHGSPQQFSSTILAGKHCLTRRRHSFSS